MNTAFQLLQALDLYGQTVTLTPKASMTYNPSTGELTEGSTTPLYTFKGYYSSWREEVLRDGLVDPDDRKLVIPNSDNSGTLITDVNVGDKVSSPEGQLKIKATRAIYESGAISCWICNVGK